MIPKPTKYNESLRDKMVGKTKNDFPEEKLGDYDVKPLLDIGFTTEEILQNKKRFKQRDLEHFSNEEIKKHNLLEKTELAGNILIKLDLTKDDITEETLHRIIPKTLNLVQFMEKFGFDRKYIEDNIEILKPTFDEDSEYLFDKYLDKKDSELNRVYDDIQFGSTYADSRSKDYYNLDKTMFIIDWFDINPSKVKLEDLKEAFSRISSWQVKNIYDRLKNRGYFKTESTQEIVNFFNEITRSGYSFNLIELYHQLFKAGVKDIDKLVFDYFLKKNDNGEYVRNSGPYGYITSPLDNVYNYTNERRERKKVEEILGSKYKDAYDKIVYYDDLNEFVKHTLSVAEHTWSRDQHKPNVQQWLDEYGLPNVETNWKDIIGRYKYEALMSYIILMAFRNKVDELYKLKGVTWDKDGNQHRSWSDGTIINNLSRVITNTEITNHSPTYKMEDELTDDQRYKLYEWVMKDIAPNIDEEHEQDLQLLYFIWDRKKLNNLIEKIKKEYTISDAFDMLKPLFEYLTDRKYSDTFYYKQKRFDRILDLKYYLDYFLQGYEKLTPKEIENLEYNLLKSPHYTGDRDYYEPANEIINKALSKFKSPEQRKGAVIGQRVIRESKVKSFMDYMTEKIQDEYFEENPDFYLTKNIEDMKKEKEQKKSNTSEEEYIKTIKKIKVEDITVDYEDKLKSYDLKVGDQRILLRNYPEGLTFGFIPNTEYNYKLIKAVLNNSSESSTSFARVPKEIINPLFKHIDDYYGVYYYDGHHRDMILFLTKSKRDFSAKLKEIKKNDDWKIFYLNNKVKGKELTDYQEIKTNHLRNKLRDISYKDIVFEKTENGYGYKYKFKDKELNNELAQLGLTNSGFFIKEGHGRKVYFGHLKNRFHVGQGLPEAFKGIGLGYKLYKAFLKHNGYYVSDEQTSTGARKMYYYLLKDDNVLHVIDKEDKDPNQGSFGQDTQKVLLVWKDHPKLEKLMRIVRKHELKSGRKYKYDKELLKYIENVKEE